MGEKDKNLAGVDNVIEEVTHDGYDSYEEDPNTVIIDGREAEGTRVNIDTPVENFEGKDPVLPDRWFWIQDSSGHASVTVTLLVVSFVITTMVYLLSTFETFLGVNMRPFDAGAAAVYFIPILTLYAQRRWTETKYEKTAEELMSTRKAKRRARNN